MAEDYVLQTKITADSTEFQNAIKGVSDSLNGIKKSLTKATDSIKKGTANWGLDLDKFYDKGSGIFKSFGVDIDKFASHFGVSGKLVSAITVATVALTKFGQSMNGARAELAKGTGAIGEDLIKLQDTFHKAMIEGIGRDAKEVGGMMADLNTRFGATGEELVAMTDEFDKFADVMGVDARQAINATADIMAKWGLETEKLSPLLDQLTTASQMSGATLDELTNGLKQGQAVFSQFGMSATDSIAMLSSFAKNGLETTTAINSMRFALNTFSKAGIDAKKGLEETIEAIKTATSETETLSIASAVFGAKNGAEMVKVLKSGALSADEFKTALMNAGGALEATDKASRTSVDAFEDLKATLTGTFAGFGEGFDNLFRDLIDSIQEVVKFIAPVIEPIGNIFRDVFSAIGQMLKILVDNFIEFQKRYNTVFSAVKTVIQTAYETIHQVLSNIVEIFGNAFSFIFAILDGKWGLAWEYAKKQVLLFSKNVADILSGIVEVFAKMINGVIEKLNSAIDLYHKLPKSVQIFDIQNIDKISENIDLASKWNITGKLAETQQKIDEITGKTSEKIIGDLGKVKEVSADVSDSMISEAMEVSQISIDWSNKLLQQEIAVLEKEREDAVAKAQLEKQTEREIFDIKKSYADKINALQIKQIEAQREAEIKKVKASKESLESQKDIIAKINKYYDTQISLIKDSTVFIEKSDKAIKESSNAWDSWIKSFEDKANDWTTMTVEMAKVGMDSMGAMFDQIGQDLVNGGSGFESYASMAVDAISQVLKALASQITALAVVAIGEKNYAKAAYLMAGATTALVASGAMKAVSNTMKGTSSALENATNNLEDFTEKLKSLWSDSSTTRAVLSSMVATDSAIKFIADDTSKLNVAMSKQEVGVKNLIYSLQNQSEETQSLYEEYKLLYESLNKYNDEVKRSGNIVINYAKVVRKELIANSKALLNEVYSDFGNYGAKIGEALMDSLLSSATKSDYLKTMKDYIKKQMLQLAVYTESFTDEIADIGLKLINSITNDGSGIDIVTKRLSDLFEKTSAVAEKIDETINKSFAKIDSLATEAVSRLNELKSSLSELRNETTQGLNSFVISYNKLNKETYTYMKQSENVYTQNIKNLDDALSEYNSALSDLEEKTKALAKAGQQKVDYSVMERLGVVNNPNFNSSITKSIGEAFDYYKEQSEKYYELLDTEKETIEQLLNGTAKDNLPNALIAFYYTYLKEFTDVYENYISAEEQLDSSRKDVNASLNSYKNANEELTKSVIEYQKALESYKTIYKNTIEETTANIKEQNATLDNQIGIYRTLYTLGKDFEKTLVSQNVFQTLKQQLLSVFESLQDSGTTIGETLVSSILEGAKTVDFLSDMKSYIRENVVKLAVYSESLQSTIAGIGTNMIQAITTGDRSKLQSLKKDLEGVYKMATNNAKELLSVIDEIFDTVEDTTEAISNSQTTFVKAMNSFKETVSDLGGDLASQIINGLTNGLSQGDFLKTMKDWIRKMLIQSVVYTESMKAEIEAIGQTISKAITGGFTEDTMHEIRRDLSWVFEQANKAVSSIDSVLGNVFSGYASGTENATKGLHIVGESGPELVAFKGGERVYNNAETMRMLNGASSSGNNWNITFNNLQDTTAYTMMSQLRDYNRQMAINSIL